MASERGWSHEYECDHGVRVSQRCDECDGAELQAARLEGARIALEAAAKQAKREAEKSYRAQGRAQDAANTGALSGNDTDAHDFQEAADRHERDGLTCLRVASAIRALDPEALLRDPKPDGAK